MFFKKLENGKYRYYEKYFDENLKKWRQVSVTMNSKSRVSQSEAKLRLAEKINSAQTKKEIKNESITLSCIFEDWQKIRQEELKPSTLFIEKAGFSKFLQKFGSEEISNIESSQIQSFLLNSNLSSASRRLRRTQYNLFFTYAKSIGYIEKNPMERVVLPKEKKTLEDLKRKQNKFLNLDEMRFILEKNRPYERDVRKLLLYEFLFLTGLRIGEALGLQWEDIDFEKQTLSVQHTLNHLGVSEKERELQTPKTVESYRTITLNNRCIEILNYFRKNLKDDSFVFVDKKGGIFGYVNLSSHFKKTCSVLGKETDERKYTLHMLRHSHISLLIEMGVPIKSIMERVGHSNEQMILRIYSHVTKKMNDDLAEKMRDFVI